MTAVRLRAHYIGRGVRGTPGQVVDLEDAAARRLVGQGRATLASAPPPAQDAGGDGQDADGPKRTKRAGGATAIRGKGRRTTKPPTEDAFMNPDVNCPGNDSRGPILPGGN